MLFLQFYYSRFTVSHFYQSLLWVMGNIIDLECSVPKSPTSNLSLTVCPDCRTMLLLDGTGLLSCVDLSLVRYSIFSYYCFVKSYRSFFWFPPPSIFSLKCLCYPDDIKLILLCSIHRLLICGALVAFLRRFWLGSLYSLVKMWFTSWIWWLISWACHQQILFHRYDLLFMEILRHVQYQA